MAVRAELKNYNCGKKLQEQELSCDIEKEGKYTFPQLIKKTIILTGCFKKIIKLLYNF